MLYAQLKLYNGKDWIWYRVRLLHTDMEYLRKYWSGKKESAPTLEKRQKKYFLRFSYQENVLLSKTGVQEQRICAVDLGINTDAACSVMKADGTVLARKFINFSSEKDQLYHVLGRIRRFQNEHGWVSAKSRWSYADRLNEELSIKISRAIAAFAKEQNCDVIVFEHLDMHGKLHGTKKQKAAYLEKTGYSGQVHASGASVRNTGQQCKCVADQCTSL